MKLFYFSFLVCIFLGACSDSSDTAEEHVWSDQVKTIEKAEAVEGMIQESVDLQERHIEEQTR
ncbi:MAG: hypothetical protein GWO08_07320 [Gammaproteobacteria bacterium]|nr:hypothetical protein [Gammaproteobacteria bacterium]NIP48669.1 hypothetical protein [Gammaproteobacteria bacterium]NIQ09121.1 hypothetical protein [Gammaproteobacteria bacterium]NIQ19049.1 hypothetical protein [Gammaproteobacteria bacterium]NIQ74139.1 hypothetical protein [Gammaproteobacteria bacterium]